MALKSHSARRDTRTLRVLSSLEALNDQLVPPGTIGEIAIRGDVVVPTGTDPRRWLNQLSTAGRTPMAAIWMKTTFMCVVDRIKDMIVTVAKRLFD